MALSASCWTGRFVGLLSLFMTSFAILMIGILCRNGFPLGLGLMAVFAKFASGFALLPGMVAFHTINLQIDMLLMGKGNLPIRRIVFNHIFCKNTTHHQEGK